MAGIITIREKGNFKATTQFLNRSKQKKFLSNLDEYGKRGVQALQDATPMRTGATAEAWDYSIVRGKDKTELIWTNSNAPQGVQVAVLIQYGHATRNGSWVEGLDYINPALAPIFEEFAREIGREVTK